MVVQQVTTKFDLKLATVETILHGAFVRSRIEQALATRLNDRWQEEGESLESYFVYFSTKLIACEMISNEKAWDALWNGLRMETSF